MARFCGVETLPGANGGRGGHRLLAAALSLCVSVAAAACNKGPARAALAESDQALAAARSLLERHSTVELAAITADTDRARALLAAGHYTEALRIAQTLPERIAKAVARAEIAKSALASEWARIAAAMPGHFENAYAQIATIEATGRRPRGLDPATLEATKADLQQARGEWAQADAALRVGDLPSALRLGKDVQARVEAVAARLAPPVRPVVRAPASQVATPPGTKPPTLEQPSPSPVAVPPTESAPAETPDQTEPTTP